jgi:hypothetical protein
MTKKKKKIKFGNSTSYQIPKRIKETKIPSDFQGASGSKDILYAKFQNVDFLL